MTALDLARRGIAFVHVGGGRLEVEAKDGVGGDVVAALRFEVGRRLKCLKISPSDGVLLEIKSDARVGFCVACGDALQPGRGGTCPLCHLAIQKYFDVDVKNDG